MFEEHGLSEARISDIAEKAELSYGAFYHYFASKEEIFRKLAASHERGLGSAVVAETASVTATAPGAAIPARLEAANRRYLAEYRREVRLMRVIEQVARHDTELNRARLERHAGYAARLADALVALQRDGLVDEAIDPVVASYLVLAMVTRFAEAWFGEQRFRCSFDEGVAQLNRLCLNALGLATPGVRR